MTSSSSLSPRVAPLIVAETWELPAAPEGASAVVQDAYRQTKFQLGGDLRLLHAGINHYLTVLRESHPSQFRTHALAVAAMLGSRATAALMDGALLVTRGSYASVPPLARTACECIAAATQLRAEELPAFEEWLAGSLHQDEAQKATRIGMGQFMASSTIVEDEAIAALYRAASELARPHIGASLALVASESNATRLAVTVADQSFHFGWAQWLLGWLLTLADFHLRLLLANGRGVFNVTEATGEAITSWSASVAVQLAQPARCRMTPLNGPGEARWLIEHFRRQSSGAPRRLLL